MNANQLDRKQHLAMVWHNMNLSKEKSFFFKRKYDQLFMGRKREKERQVFHKEATGGLQEVQGLENDINKSHTINQTKIKTSTIILTTTHILLINVFLKN